MASARLQNPEETAGSGHATARCLLQNRLGRNAFRSGPRIRILARWPQHIIAAQALRAVMSENAEARSADANSLISARRTGSTGVVANESRPRSS